MSALKRWMTYGLGLALLAPGARVAKAQAAAEDIRVTLGKSVVLDYPEDVARISTSNPDVVDYVPVSTREILLHAKTIGAATVVVWAKSGQRNFYNITIEQNLEPVRKLIRETFPNEEIQVHSAREAISVNGTVSSQAVVDRLVALLTPLGKGVTTNMKIKPPAVEKQILLRVRFAELNRKVAETMGVNIVSTGFLNTPGAISTQQFSSPRATALNGTIGAPTTGTTSTFNITDALNIFAFRPDLNLSVFIKMLQSQGMLQILAEPNLVTSNGKEASFLVGGEFPVPVLQGGANSGAVTVQFREFGIRLTFNPILTENGTLKMTVKPEVSTIDLANAVTVSGFTIPALATRRIESSIELQPGQSFVIGGLIDERTDDAFNRIPGLASIPVLGVLFKSKSENKSKTELIVMVTPETVDPMDPNDPRTKIAPVGEPLTPILLPNGVPASNQPVKPVPPAPTKRQDLYRKQSAGVR